MAQGRRARAVARSRLLSGRVSKAAVEVADVEVAAACVREEQQAVSSRPEFVERLDRDRLQRVCSAASWCA